MQEVPSQEAPLGEALLQVVPLPEVPLLEALLPEAPLPEAPSQEALLPGVPLWVPPLPAQTLLGSYPLLLLRAVLWLRFAPFPDPERS